MKTLAIVCMSVLLQLHLAAQDRDVNTPLYETNQGAQLRFQSGEIPQYPALAVQARVSGRIKLKVTIKDGGVIQVEPPKVSGATTMLQQAAIENVKTWKFLTRSLERFDVTYDYQLTKDEVEVPENPTIEMVLPVYVRMLAKPVKPQTSY